MTKKSKKTRREEDIPDKHGEEKERREEKRRTSEVEKEKERETQRKREKREEERNVSDMILGIFDLLIWDVLPTTYRLKINYYYF